MSLTLAPPDFITCRLRRRPEAGPMMIRRQQSPAVPAAAAMPTMRQPIHPVSEPVIVE